jgi:hypothetical protein
VLQHLDAFGMRNAAVMASPIAGSSRKNSVLRARIVTFAAQPGERLRQFQRHH